jgi:hypothetical protein
MDDEGTCRRPHAVYAVLPPTHCTAPTLATPQAPISSTGAHTSRHAPTPPLTCGMAAMRPRTSSSPSSSRLWPSSMMVPWNGSTRRNSDTISELLPLPVRPTMPILSPGRTKKLTPANDGPSGRVG